MPRELAIALTDASLGATVATALAHQKYRLVLVQIDQSFVSEPKRAAMLEQQAAFFKPYRHHVLKHDTLVKPGKREANQVIDPRSHDDLGQRLTQLLPVIARGIEAAAHYDASSIHLGLSVGMSDSGLPRSVEHLQIWNELVQASCGKSNMEIHAPLLELDPWQIVDLATQVEAPLQLSWDCEMNQTDPCGTCGGCRWRDAAFGRAAKPDPLRANLPEPPRSGVSQLVKS
jgi:Queuosine biosynthesis protein QueC